MIPEDAQMRAFSAAKDVQTVLVVGTSGTVMPACDIPRMAKRHGALVIEVNPVPSTFTSGGITDLYLPGT